MAGSPYDGLAPEAWKKKTEELANAHPLDTGEIVDVVRTSWNAIFESSIGGKFKIGKDISPKPQIMGFFLHELIPLELSSRYPKLWRPEQTKTDKDLVYIPDDAMSVELKTSSHATQIFGNRSYAQDQAGRGKSKDGYYLAVNFEKFGAAPAPTITLIRFGWLDHTDWIGQRAATGQQARIAPTSEKAKLLVLYRSE